MTTTGLHANGGEDALQATCGRFDPGELHQFVQPAVTHNTGSCSPCNDSTSTGDGA